MDTIFSSFSEFFSSMSSFVPEALVDLLLCLSVFSLVYFVFIRSLLCLFSCDRVKRLLDIVYIVISVCLVIFFLLPEFRIVKTIVTGTDLARCLS